MRGVAAVAFGVAAACYRPSAAPDQPCAANHDCPSGQHCDLGQSPPICVTGDGGAAGGGGDASSPDDARHPHDAVAVDARGDGANVTPPDAKQIDAAPPPPITFVHARSTKPSAATTTLNVDQIVAGNALIVGFNYPGSATVVSLTDSFNNTFDFVVNDYLGNGEQHYIAAAYDITAATNMDTITLTLSAGVSGADLFVAEYSGLATNGFDVTTAAAGSDTAMDSGSATTRFAHELLFGYAEAPSATAGSGFTERSLLSGNLIEDAVVDAVGSYDATATTTAGGWTMLLATFRGQ